MNYPVVCFLDENTNHKMFLVPLRNALVDFGRTKELLDDKISFGTEVFLSLFKNEFENVGENYSLYTVKTKDLANSMMDFEKATLLTSYEYDIYAVMDQINIKLLPSRDKEMLEAMVEHNKEELLPSKTMKMH